MGSFFKFIFISLSVIVLGGVLLLGYFGFVPIVSDLMGSNRPKDLGMRFSQENFDSALDKSKVEMKQLDPVSKEIISYQGSHDVKETFTDDELTAHANNKDWVGYPVSDVQVRINDNNTAEVSGILKLSQIQPFLQAMNISQTDFENALQKYHLPLRDIPFYAKGLGSASDNVLNIKMTNFELGKINVPQNILNQYQDELTNFGNSIMKSIPGFAVHEARFEDNSIYFDGSLPDVELTKRVSH
jgi:hypothetical protein